MKRTIKNPHYTNNARTIMSCEFHYDDGRVLTASIHNSDGKNPDWIEIHNTFSRDELEKNTQAAIKRVNDENRRREEDAERMAEKQRQEALYAVKLDAFNIEAVKNSTNRVLKSKIRKAKSPLEVSAYTAALLLKEIETEQ
jgi:hypothetical protein